MKKKIYRAGFIPFYLNENNKIEMYFMFPSKEKFGGNQFQLCKGKVEKGESAKEAAIRECKEELGLFVPNIKGDIYELGRFLGRTDVFVAEITDPDMFGDTDKETKDRSWMTLEEFQKDGRALHKPVVRAAERLIQKITM